MRAFKLATKPTIAKVIGFSSINSRTCAFNILSKRQISSVSLSQNSSKKMSQTLDTEISTELDDKFHLDKQFQTFMNEKGYKAIDKPGNVITDLVKKSGSETIHTFIDTAAIVYTSSSYKSLQEQMQHEPEALDGLDDDNVRELSTTEVKVVIEQNGKASLYELQLSLFDFDMSIISITFFDNADAAIKECNGIINNSSLSYGGPEFSNLDPELQAAIVEYLKARGFGDELWELVVAYSGVKENDDYINWLQNFKKFVDSN